MAAIVRRTLFALGVTLLAWYGAEVSKARSFQASARVLLAQAEPGDASGVIGTLEIPRLKMSVVVAEGDDPETLNVAVGHLPDTPLP